MYYISISISNLSIYIYCIFENDDQNLLLHSYLLPTAQTAFLQQQEGLFCMTASLCPNSAPDISQMIATLSATSQLPWPMRC